MELFVFKAKTRYLDGTTHVVIFLSNNEATLNEIHALTVASGDHSFVSEVLKRTNQETLLASTIPATCEIKFILD